MHGQWLHKNYLQLRIQHCAAAAAASDNDDGDDDDDDDDDADADAVGDVNRCPHVLA